MDEKDINFYNNLFEDMAKDKKKIKQYVILMLHRFDIYTYFMKIIKSTFMFVLLRLVFYDEFSSSFTTSLKN